jgi:hypothetical protein
MRFNEQNLTGLIARTAPWLSPIPTAYLVGISTYIHLHWFWGVSVIAGLVIEALGLSAMNTALELRQHNRNLKEDHRQKYHAPATLPWLIVVIYFISVIALTVVLDTRTDLAVYAPVIFPVLSLSGVALIALRQDHDSRIKTMVLSRIPPYNTKYWKGIREQLLAETEYTPQDTDRNIEATNPPVSDTKPPVSSPEKYKYWCEFCGWGTNNANAYAGHCKGKTHKEKAAQISAPQSEWTGEF